MKKAYNKDILRSIWSSRKRFLSILAITALGVTVLTGIYAACQDMYYSADRFYDQQGLFDIRVLSTLGLTDEDVKALQGINGIEKAEGAYSETADTMVQDLKHTVQVIMLSRKEINAPYVLEGRLPVQPGEIAVTRKYMEEAGKNIGDTLTIKEKLDEAEKDGEKGDTSIKEASHKATADAPSEIKENEEIEWDAEVEVEEEAETPNFKKAEYVITAVVLDPMDISNNNTLFRSAASAADYTFFILPEDIESDIYTCVYITINGMKELDCYSDEYKAGVKKVIDEIEAKIKARREIDRYNAIRREAEEKIADAESTMNEKFAAADDKFREARDEIEEGRQEIIDGEERLSKEEKEALLKIADARAEIADGKEELTLAQKELKEGENTLLWSKMELINHGQALENAKETLQKEREKAAAKFAEIESEMAEQQYQIDQNKKRLETGIEQLKIVFGQGWPEAEWNALTAAAARKTENQLKKNPDQQSDPVAIAGEVANEAQALGMAVTMLQMANGDPAIDYTDYTANCIELAIGMGIVQGSQNVFNEGMNLYKAEKEAAGQKMADAEAEIKSGEIQLEEGWIQWNDGWAEWEKGRQELEDGWAKLLEGEEELNKEEAKAQKEIADAWQEIKDGKQKLADGETELLENEEEYQEKKKDAKEKIADAYVKLDEIDMAEWYVQDRSSLSSYSGLKNDMSSIESVGGAFPIVFLVVAILISLTTMTRMVEEERGLIGTYKALGLSNGAVYRKYLWYALLACILGGALGDILGFIAVPKFLLMILKELYILPYVELRFDLVYGIGGILLFIVGIVGATVMVCRSELIQMPAALMRPKAPRIGSRVFLERIPFIWSRLKFLNKVTVRNLFRYKKRFFMTVLGIMGCTALVLAGFSIKDSVTSMMPKQYEDIYQYDLMAVADAKDNQKLLKLADQEEMITDYVNMETSNIKVINSNQETETVQLMVVPDGALLEGYIRIRDIDRVPVSLNSEGILITKNAADILNLQTGDTVSLQKLNLDRGDVKVSAVVQNYLGNHVYMEKTLYESLFGTYSPNGILAHISPECNDQMAYAEDLLEQEFLLSSISVEGIKKDFSSHFALINSVVYMIIILAAGLAFVVLFTLSNTNISERSRELATTKVLGFYDREVHAYVNKETLILTALGILVGLPVGRFLSSLLTTVLVMPAMYFETYVAPASYGYTIIISFSFALIVNVITNRTLNRINMVEALKSVE